MVICSMPGCQTTAGCVCSRVSRPPPCPRCSFPYATGAAAQNDALVKALEDALCELSACAIQMNCRSGGSVVRAIEAARHALAVVGSPKP
jgi:hypothetical protein